MKKIIVLVAILAVVGLGVKAVFAAPVGNPLKEPARGNLLVGYEWTLVDDKDLEHSDYSGKQEYKADFHLAKFTYGLLDGLTVNGELGLGKVKNINQSVPHGYQFAWGGGATWNVLENLNSVWSQIPEKLPYDIDVGLSGRYIGIEGDGDNPHPSTLPNADYTYDENWQEIQTSMWIAKDFGAFTPYGGLSLSWVRVRQKEDQNTGGNVTSRHIRDASDPGCFVGFDLSPGKWERLSKNPVVHRFLKDMNISFEFRGESETALTAGASWLWKY